MATTAQLNAAARLALALRRLSTGDTKPTRAATREAAALLADAHLIVGPPLQARGETTLHWLMHPLRRKIAYTYLRTAIYRDRIDSLAWDELDNVHIAIDDGVPMGMGGHDPSIELGVEWAEIQTALTHTADQVEQRIRVANSAHLSTIPDPARVLANRLTRR